MTRLKNSFTMAAIITVVHAMVACGSMLTKEERQWQPTAVADFKGVAGKWQGLLVRNPRTRDDDWVTDRLARAGPDRGQLIADSGSSERILRAVAKDSEGFHYWADLKRAPQTLSPRRLADS